MVSTATLYDRGRVCVNFAKFANFCQPVQSLHHPPRFLVKMPMRLRLAVHGRRNDRIFHLVAINQRTRRNGKPTELLGIYDPRVRPGGPEHKTMEWSTGRIRYWLDVGAVPSKTVVKLLEMVSIGVHSSLSLYSYSLSYREAS